MRVRSRGGKVEFETLMFMLGGGAVVVFAIIAYMFLSGNGDKEENAMPPAEQRAAAPPAEEVVSPTPEPASQPAEARVTTGECRPGETRTEACNPNDCSRAGSRTRTCTDGGAWGPWGDCGGCSGTVERECRTPNGCPGTSPGRCENSCEVSGWGECRSEGVCTASEKKCFDERNYQACGADDCLWGKVVPCPSGTVCQDGNCVKPKAVCEPGTTQQKPCNPSGCPQGGNSVRVCNQDGLWGIWSGCSGCGGRECTSADGYRECSNDCSWRKPVSCGADEKCTDGACAATGARFMKREKPGPGGQLRNHPLRRKNGEEIRSAAVLFEAYGQGEIVVYRDGREIPVPQKASSRIASFGSTESRELAGGIFVAMSAASCEKIGGSILGKLVRVASAPGNYSGYQGKVYRVAHDYVDGCHECWGAGPCFAPKGFDIVGDGGGEGAKGWTWELFSMELVHGSSAGANEIAIDPVKGTVVGEGDLEVSYHY